MNKTMIVSDVGGTNGRFAIAEFSDQNHLPEIKNTQIFPCSAYASFYDMFAAYARHFKTGLPKTAHFAIAGEMTPRHGNLWHFNWNINAAELEDRFGFEQVTLLNDYEALLYAIPELSNNDLTTLSPSRKEIIDAPYSVFGVGSGLGAAIGVPTSNGLTTIPTEIGHISFAPKSELELEMLRYFKENNEPISIEFFLSGPGIKRIHDFIIYKESGKSEIMTAADITAAAKQKNIENCVKTVDVFANILGNVTGDIALAQGAKGGIYMGGGVIPKIKTLIDHQKFLTHFRDKGPMQNYVKKIPVHIITSKNPALLGAAIAPPK